LRDCYFRLRDRNSFGFKRKAIDAGFSHGENRGAGLGLFIAKKFIELCGGNIRVQDNLPQGTTFVITLERAF